MRYLVFQLYAPLASWGEAATGEVRRSADHPGRSAILGLVGAALGLRRESELELSQLRDGIVVAVKQLSSGQLLRDYHTAQVPGRTRGVEPQTRREELAGARDKLHTILSTRDYRCDGVWRVALRSLADCPWGLDEIAEALRQPKFHLYLGRKGCPPSAPLDPVILDAMGVREALAMPLGRLTALAEEEERLLLGLGKRAEYFWEGDGGDITPRETRWSQDQPLHRGRWQFSGRPEHWRMEEGG